MVVAEPDVSIEKLKLLLAAGHEAPELDYKEEVALDDVRGMAEIAKDVGAMQSLPGGGFLVVGVSNEGKPTGRLGSNHQLFDEANLRSKLRKYIPEPLVVLSAVHEIDEDPVALIYVGPSPQGFCVFKCDGQYPKPGGSVGLAFREGDVFIRRGTASRRWSQSELQTIWDRERNRIREEERANYTGMLAEEVARVVKASSLTSSAEALDWNISEESFQSMVRELMMAGKTVGLASIALDMERSSSELAGTPEEQLLIDRMLSFAAMCISLEEKSLLGRALRLLKLHYRREASSVSTWLRVSTGILALGALALRSQSIEVLRELVMWSPSDDSNDNNPLRHTITMAARASVLGEKGELIELARRYISDHPSLRPDVADGDEAIINSLCQFDFAWCVMAIGEGPSKMMGHHWYPSFGRFEGRRIAPLVEALITEGSPTRGALFPGTDEQLSAALFEIMKMTKDEHFFTWHGMPSTSLTDWMYQHRGEGSGS